MDTSTYTMVPNVLVLSEKDAEFLKQYGNWLERLEGGVVAPTTEMQRRFLAVVRGEIAPQSPHELLWLKVRATKQAIWDHIQAGVESDRCHFANRLASQAALVDKLYTEIESYNDRIERDEHRIQELQRLLAKYEPAPAEESSTKREGYAFCRQCGGDGGAAGSCPRCGGTGWDPEPA